MPSSSPSRLAYIDWLRGFACLLMFQTHCYDAWLGGAARDSKFAMWSHLGGTFPAPLFLFLAGISVAIVVDKLLQKGSSAHQIGKKIVYRGAQIFALGLLFRVQEYVISWGWAPWTDLFRVDILNTIGAAIMLMGSAVWLVLSVRRSVRTVLLSAPEGWPGSAQDESTGKQRDVHRDANWTTGRTWIIAISIVAAGAISALAPLLWTTWRPRFLPWELETYINGVHTFDAPQPWLFPIFPWVGFAFAGLALGFFLMSGYAKKRGAWVFLGCGITGLLVIYVAKFIDSHGWQVYPVYDYWHTSPAFFTTRVGLLFILVLGAYAWCRWGPGQWGFSPMIQLGQTSLLVYWVHIEFVYGRFQILPPRSQNIFGASEGLLIIFVSMLVLSLARTGWKKLRPQLFGPKNAARAAESA